MPYIVPSDWRLVLRNFFIFLLILVPIGIHDGMFWKLTVDLRKICCDELLHYIGAAELAFLYQCPMGARFLQCFGCPKLPAWSMTSAVAVPSELDDVNSSLQLIWFKFDQSGHSGSRSDIWDSFLNSNAFNAIGIAVSWARVTVVERMIMRLNLRSVATENRPERFSIPFEKKTSW